MSTDVERLRGNLKRLGLHAIADLFEREAQKAAKAKQSYVGFLDHLVDEELARKADRSVNARIIRGRFPTVKTLEGFQFDFQPSIPAPLIRELAELGFLARAEIFVWSGRRGPEKRILVSPSGSARAAPTSACCFAPSRSSSTSLSPRPSIAPWGRAWRRSGAWIFWSSMSSGISRWIRSARISSSN
jgi:hypothetical protein